MHTVAPDYPDACKRANVSGRVLVGITVSAKGLVTEVEVLEGQGVRTSFCGAVELLEPLHPDTPVGRFLARRGPGLHHIAYRTPDLEAELRRLEKEGIELIDSQPRAGARGHRIAFLHPRSTGGVLIELVESDDAHAAE